MKNCRGIFITGTDTGVGKTFVAAGILKVMKSRGMSVCPMKPVESGCRLVNGKLRPPDALQLLKISGVREDLDIINPYRLRHALAPSVAAEMEGVHIDKKKILDCYRKLSGRHDTVIVEGAGGLMVPVYRDYLFSDMIEDFGLPLVIVARSGLGTINHTLLTLEAARNRGIEVAGVVFNDSEQRRRGAAEKTSPEVVRRLGETAILGTIPYSRSAKGDRRVQKAFENTTLNILSQLSPP